MVGMNVHGKDWTDVFDHLKKFETHIFGDYGNWDLRTSYEVFLGPMFIIEGLITKFKKTEWFPYLGIMWKLVDALSLPTYLVNGDVIEVYGTIPSGMSGTARWNSLANLLVIVMAFREIVGEDFFDFCVAIFYGDDHVVSTNHPDFKFKDLRHWVNAHGMVYTTADKDKDELYPPSDIFSVSFVKRKFKIDPVLDRVLAPIDPETPLNMLSSMLRSESIHSAREQSYMLLTDAHREIFLIPELWNSLDSQLRNIMQTDFPEKPPLPESLDYHELIREATL